MAQLVKSQARAAVAAAVLVTTKALVARAPAPRALPALKPNQPNQRRPAPRTDIPMLWASIGSRPYPSLLPSTTAAARAETPELIWTTVPPAKSSAPILRSQPSGFSALAAAVVL